MTTKAPMSAQFNLTGFDYTDIAATFAKAGAETGVQVVKHPTKSDSLLRPQRQRHLRRRGHSIHHAVGRATSFPDYHQPGDEWQKLDYDNLAKVDTTVALGILAMANSDQVPQWNKENPKTSRYVQAREK